MPRITKYAEKIKCVKPNFNTILQSTYGTKTDLFSLIEEIINNTLPEVSSKFFNEFVDIKEVPYGRYNSDSDYRGS